MKQQDKQLPFSFPKKFLWGAATSAHQVEGNTHNQWTVWELENAKALAERSRYEKMSLPNWKEEVEDLARDPSNYVSGVSTDHYNKYEEDFDIMQKLNMNAFRFSIEWSRIEPEQGKWNPAEIEHYRNYLKALKARGIEPMMTLMHWTLPTWFTDIGGFEKRRNVKYFVRFAEKVLDELSADVRYVCTINEPEVYTAEGWYTGNWPPNKRSKYKALRVYFNLAYAHNQVAKTAHRMGRRFKVGMSKNCAHHYPGDDAVLTRITAKVVIWASDYVFLNRVRRNLDWLGLNYYFSNRYYGYRAHNPNQRLSDMGWDMQPENIQFVIERLHDKYKVPIIVTENGLADHKDESRKWWILHTMIGIHKAAQNGAIVDGYLHWSLLDNFEWAHGKWPRFGLVHVDYKTLKRTPRPSALWYGQILKKVRK